MALFYAEHCQGVLVALKQKRLAPLLLLLPLLTPAGQAVSFPKAEATQTTFCQHSSPLWSLVGVESIDAPDFP